jgi:hypothetical protein
MIYLEKTNYYLNFPHQRRDPVSVSHTNITIIFLCHADMNHFVDSNDNNDSDDNNDRWHNEAVNQSILD